MTAVVVGLGGNLGEPAKSLQQALETLRQQPEISRLRCSSLVRSAPLGDKPQPDYCNAVAQFECELPPSALLNLLQSIEDAAGRERQGERWSSRTLDLDILAYGDAVIDTDALTVPHSQVTQRSFVVQPWLEIDPDARLATGERLAELPVAAEAGLEPWTDATANSRII